MSKEQIITQYCTGPADFDAYGYSRGFAGAMAQIGIPMSESIDEAKENDPDWKTASFVKITFEVINPDDEAPAHEHLKESSDDRD